MTFEIKDLSRLKYTMQGMAAIKEGLFEGYYGKKNISYRDEPKQVRLMIKHNKNIPEGEARYRAIESLYVETADGERFKVPSRNLTHGRMLARHVAEGGNPYDTFGQHITQIVNEMSTLSRFIRASRGKEYTGETANLVGNAVRHYQDLKAKAKRMIGQRGYTIERESFDPAAVSDTEITAEAVRNMFVEQSVDQRIEEALPILAKLASTEKENNMKEVNQFESWVNKVCEGTWALPDSPDSMNKFNELLSKPLIVGADATNATEQLYDLVGDDELFDRLNDLAEQDPNANCWDDLGVLDRLEELGIDTSMVANDNEENIDIDINKHGIDPEGDYDQDNKVDESEEAARELTSMRKHAGIKEEEIDEGVAEGTEDRSRLIHFNTWTVMDSDEVVMKHSVERDPFFSAKKFIRQLDDEGYEFTHVISPEGRVTYLPQHDPRHLKNFSKDEMDEGMLDTVKKVGNSVLDKLGGGSDEELLDKLRKDAGLPPRMAIPNKKPDRDVEEDLDTDGVMMTKPSNMSS